MMLKVCVISPACDMLAQKYSTDVSLPNRDFQTHSSSAGGIECELCGLGPWTVDMWFTQSAVQRSAERNTPSGREGRHVGDLGRHTEFMCIMF